MAADTKTHLYEWSTTESSNYPVGSTVISTNLDDNLRMIQKVVRDLASPTTLAASAGTTDLGTKDETFITLTGTAVTITGFGTVSAGIYKFVIFNAAHVLTYNATSLRLPGNANITTADGDVALFVSLGSGYWNCLSYLRKSGSPVTAGSFSGLTAAIATNTIANGDYNQNWTWIKSTATKPALFIGETTASTGVDAVILELSTAAASTAWPIQVKARTEEVFVVKEDGETFLASAAGQNLRIGYKSDVSVPSTTATPGAVYLKAQSSTDSTNGGGVSITGGNTDGGVGGAVNITGGASDTGGTGGDVVLTGGTGATGGDVELNAANVVVTSVGGLWLYGTKLKVFANTPPTITADGGAGAAIAGSDAVFQVTFGSGSPTSVTVTFNAAYGVAPYVLVSGTQSGQIVHVAAVNTTTVQISSSTAFSSGTKITVMCIEQGA